MRRVLGGASVIDAERGAQSTGPERLDERLSLPSYPPALLFARTVKIMLRGEWRRQDRMETSAVSAFVAMLLIPVSLTMAFLLDALFR